MPRATANDIEIEYDTAGDPADPAVLLIMGLGAQMTTWPVEFVDALVERGLYVIRFDNRDIGLSTFFDDAGIPDLIGAIATGTMLTPAYTLDDMADDAAGLLGVLGVSRAHIVGASMGGMIAQTFALRHPDLTASLVSVMSTTGNPSVGAPAPGVVEALFFSPAPTTRDEAMDSGVAAWKLIGSPGYPFHEDRIRTAAAAAFDRSFHPEGVARQLVAIVNQPDRTADLGKLSAPALVIHGEADPLIEPSGGRATADAIPGSTLWTVPGMGHDLPVELIDEMADRIAKHALTA